jgi:hypothetical protein
MKLISAACHALDVNSLVQKLKEDGVEVVRTVIIKVTDPHTFQEVPSNQRIVIFRVMNEETETMLGLKYPPGMFQIYR